MGIVTVYITINNIGADTGPFDIYDNFTGLLATNITKAELAAGVPIDVKESASQITVYSKGICDNTLLIPITTFPLSPTPSPTPTLSATNTPTPTATVSRTPTLSPSVTPSITISPSATPSITVSPSITISPSVTPSLSVSISITPSVTPSISISNTPSVTPSVTPSLTPSISISNTPSVTPSISISQTPSITPSVTATTTPSTTPSISISTTPSITPTRTPSPSPNNTIYWNWSPTLTQTGVSFSITKNGSTVVSQGSSPGFGNFSYTPGDTISVDANDSIKYTGDWTQVCVFNSAGAVLYSDKQQDTTSTVSFSTSSGRYDITGQQSTTEPLSCIAPE